jgi:hypothetical protein
MDKAELAEPFTEIPKTNRITEILNAVGNKLKRLSMTVADATNSLKAQRKPSAMNRANNQRDTIDLSDLEKLQTESSHRSFEEWLVEKVDAKWSFEKCAESTFSEVFIARNGEKSMVIKVMPLADSSGKKEKEKEEEEETPIPVPIDAAFHEISALTAIRDRVKQVNKYAVPTGWTGFADLIQYW